MKKTIITLLLATLCITSAYADFQGECCHQSEEAIQQATYGHIDSKGLKALLDAETPLALIDARGNKWHDNSKILGALLASYETPQSELESLIPHADSLIVVYCFSATCPLSDKLANKLVEYGYNNILVYPAGLKIWRDVAQYPIEAIRLTP